MIILGIILALSLTGANGISFSGTTDNEAFQATVDADINDAAAVNYIGSGDLSFAGSGNAKYAKSYKTGTTSSQVGITIKNADAFAGHIGGRKNIKNKATSAYLDVSAQGFDFLKAYGSSVAGSVKSGVDLEVVNGDATFSIGTWANGKSMKTVSSLATGEGNFIQGSEIEASGYFSGCKGELGAYLEEGYLEDYELSLASSKYDGCFAYQSADWALGDHMDFWAETKKTASGITKEMEADIEVIDGAIEDYEAHINDVGTDYHLTQSFDAVSADELDTDTYYMELSKAGKIVATADSDMDNGIATEYTSTATDPSVTQEFATVDADYLYMNNHLTDITKKATKNTDSTLRAGYWDGNIRSGNGNGIPQSGVYVEDLHGASFVGNTGAGTAIEADNVESDDIYVFNGYKDNLRKDGGYGEAGAEIHALSDHASLTNYVGAATYETTGEKEVRSQGHLDDQDGKIYTDDYTNGYREKGFDTDDLFTNYFFAKTESASPWLSTLDTGHQLDATETIQQAINLIPAGFSIGDSNIFLLGKTYNENKIVNNNDYERSFNLLGAAYYLPRAENTVIDADTNGDGIGESGIFDLYSETGDRYFGFQNINFKNGYEATWAGGAIDTNRDLTSAYTFFVDVDQCDFIYNYAKWGGAIYNYGGNLDVRNSNFYSNSAEDNGGAIENDQGTTHISGGIFQGNSALGWGGALDNSNGQLSTTGVSFINNNALVGGAVSVENDPSIGTGAQYNSNNDEFNGNGADWGGAIENDQGTTHISGGIFQGNFAFEVGGAIENDQGTTHISGGIFQDNFALGLGGALINVNGQLSTTDVSFIGNSAQLGGAVAVVNDPSIGTGAQYNSNNDEFNGNVADWGGAIYLDAGTVVNVASGNFVNNMASIAGGAVLIDQTSGAASYIDDAATTYSGNNPNDIETIS
jgi:hypothetical protein